MCEGRHGADGGCIHLHLWYIWFSSGGATPFTPCLPSHIFGAICGKYDLGWYNLSPYT